MAGQAEPPLPFAATVGVPGAVGAAVGCGGAFFSSQLVPDRPVMLFLAGLLAFPGVLFALWRMGSDSSENDESSARPASNEKRRRERLRQRMEEESRKAVSLGLLGGFLGTTGLWAAAPALGGLLISGESLGVLAQVLVVAGVAWFVKRRSAAGSSSKKTRRRQQ